MFDFGFAEMLLTAVIGLLVLGPKRLPKAARTVGLWVRKARASWFSLRAELERELDSEDIKAGLREARSEVSRLREELSAPLIPPPSKPQAASIGATADSPADRPIGEQAEGEADRNPLASSAPEGDAGADSGASK